MTLCAAAISIVFGVWWELAFQLIGSVPLGAMVDAVDGRYVSFLGCYAS